MYPTQGFGPESQAPALASGSLASSPPDCFGSAIRAAVYIDGFNVYFRLKGTPYKWLDYGALVRALLPADQDLRILKYFTARINGRFDADAPTRQDVYLRALRAHVSGLVIIEGSFLVTTKRSRLADNPNQFVEVLNPEEKGSDVNLAVHLINDACRDAFDVAYVMSNDSDLAEAIRLVKEDHEKPVGLIVPGNARPAARLRSIADPVLRSRVGFMGQHQLPSPIPGTSIRKPESW